MIVMDKQKPVVPEPEFLKRVLGNLRGGKPDQVRKAMELVESRLGRVK